MKKQNLNEMWRGWFIGNFEPSILKTENFEVGLLSHKKGEIWPQHYHAVATEYNLLVSGSMTICGELVSQRGKNGATLQEGICNHQSGQR